MKKTLLTLVTSLFLFAQANAEMAIGVTANMAKLDTEGTHTLRETAVLSKASHTEDVVVPEIFFELLGDMGAVGIAYVPVQELGSKSRTDTNSEADTGTYTAKAELDSHVLFYADLNMMEVANQQFYLKAGLNHATLVTKEALNSGSTYSDDEVWGTTVGLGVRGDVYGSYFYKLEGTFTKYDTYEDSSENATTANKVVADTEVTSVKVSVGYKF